MDDSTLYHSKIDRALSVLECEVTLLAHKSCQNSPDMAAIGRRRRLDKLNNKVIQVREAYQQLVEYENLMDKHIKSMKSLEEEFSDLFSIINSETGA